MTHDIFKVAVRSTNGRPAMQSMAVGNTAGFNGRHVVPDPRDVRN